MNSKSEIVTLNPGNSAEYGCPCFLNPKNEGHLKKLEWLQERFSEGLTIKLLLVENEKKPIGFIEYVPVEYAWRAVNANRYIFIHCIWVYPNKYKEKGYGSLLVEECIEDAKKEGRYGVAVVASTGPFMAGVSTRTPLPPERRQTGIVSAIHRTPSGLTFCSHSRCHQHASLCRRYRCGCRATARTIRYDR